MSYPFVKAGPPVVSHLVDSPIGPLALTSDGTALTELFMLDPGQRGPGLPQDPEPFAEVEAQLKAYFAGELERFTVPLAPTGSPFQLAVWAELTRIPYGFTTTYGDIAKALGKGPAASRAVGAANGANPIPVIVPCHRVIGANGGLTGFGGGLPRKLALLKVEGAAGLW